jgi:hypothetical protein
MLGFTDESIRPLTAHQKKCDQQEGEWFNNADNYKVAM